MDRNMDRIKAYRSLHSSRGLPAESPKPQRLPELEPRALVGAIPDVHGRGWLVTLECGHENWHAVRPLGPAAFCGRCIAQVTQRLRERQVIE